MFNIVLKNNTTNLRIDDFNKWMNKIYNCDFNQFNNELNTSDFIKFYKNQNKKLTVEFVSGIKTEKHGLYSVADVKKYIKEHYRLNDNIKGILDIIKNRKDFNIYCNDLIGSIKRYNEEMTEEEMEDLKNRIKNIYFDVIILGTYDYDSLTITLYPDAINKYGKNHNFGLYSVYELEFVDLFIHLVHYYKAYEKIQFIIEMSKRHDYTSKVVKDSVSTYFTNIYNDMYKVSLYYLSDLQDFSPVTYSKAGMLYILDINHLLTILNESIYDMDQALRMMLKNNQVFFDIKNLAYSYAIKAAKTNRKTSSKYDRTYLDGYVKDYSSKKSSKTALDYERAIIRAINNHLNISIQELFNLDIKSIINHLEEILDLLNSKESSAVKSFIEYLSELFNKTMRKISEEEIRKIAEHIVSTLRSRRLPNKVFTNDVIIGDINKPNNFKFIVNPVTNEYDDIVDITPFEIEDEELLKNRIRKIMMDKGLRNTDVYRGDGVDNILPKATFNKIINWLDKEHSKDGKEYYPAKDTIILVCIGLGLTYEESMDLMSVAGFTLSNSIGKDIIIAKLLKEGCYDVNYYNAVLLTFGYPFLKGSMAL